MYHLIFGISTCFWGLIDNEVELSQFGNLIISNFFDMGVTITSLQQYKRYVYKYIVLHAHDVPGSKKKPWKPFSTPSDLGEKTFFDTFKQISS